MVRQGLWSRSDNGHIRHDQLLVVPVTLRGVRLFLLRNFITSTLQDRQSRILRETRIGSRALAQVESRPAIGVNLSHKCTTGAKTNWDGRWRVLRTHT